MTAAIVFTSASLGASSALAQVIGDSPQALDLVDMSACFGDSFEEGNSGATFADRFTFTVEGTVAMNLDAIDASVSRSADVGLDITGLWLFDGNDTLISQGTSMSTGATDVWTVAGGNLAGSTAPWYQAMALPSAAP